MAASTGRIPLLATAIGLCGLLCGPALAQNQNSYGLTDMKPYSGTLNSPQDSSMPNSPATNARQPSPRPGGAPVISLHAFGGAFVDSRIGR